MSSEQTCSHENMYFTRRSTKRCVSTPLLFKTSQTQVQDLGVACPVAYSWLDPKYGICMQYAWTRHANDRSHRLFSQTLACDSWKPSSAEQLLKCYLKHQKDLGCEMYHIQFPPWLVSQRSRSPETPPSSALESKTLLDHLQKETPSDEQG